MTTENNKKESEAMKYRKKPVVIDAVQWLGTGNSWDEIQDMGLRNFKPGEMGERSFFITTLEGDMKCNEGDWVIKGVEGEFYPCKPDIFEKIYEPATPPSIEGEIKSKEAKDYIHLGIEFSQRGQFKDSGASYISGVGFGYSCGYQDGEKAASQFTPSKEKEYREALQKICRMNAAPSMHDLVDKIKLVASKALNK